MNTAYCTYFDKNYLPRGLALLESLHAHDAAARVTVLCLDSLTHVFMKRLNLPGVSLLFLGDLEKRYPELVVAKENRDLVEYYWTLTPVLLTHLLHEQAEGDGVVYVDADHLFFASPDSITGEVAKHDVTLQPHNFPERTREALLLYGRYNVGILGARNTDAGRAVIGWWRERCLEWCYARVDGETRYGDQKYLDFFAEQAPGVGEFQNPGIGVAPWNHENASFTRDGAGNVLFGNSPLVVYHFHSLAIVHPDIVLPSKYDSAYHLSLNVVEHCYAPYIAALDRAFARLRTLDPSFSFGMSDDTVDANTPLLVRTSQVDALCAGLPHAHYAFGEFTYLAPVHPALWEERGRQDNLWEGDYASWEEAEQAATGYDSEEIVNKAVAAARLVRDGKAVCERDTVVLPDRQYLWPTLSGVLLGAARNGGEVHLVDFGGALGSTYRTILPFLWHLKKIRWHVVELPRMVQAGKREFQTEQLLFHDSLEKCLEQYRVDGILLGGVLQYLPDSYGFFDSLCSMPFDYMILDRTPFKSGKGDRICVQHVPEWIYKASYPCRMLDYAKCLKLMTGRYDIADIMPALEGTVKEMDFKGIIAVARDGATVSHSLQSKNSAGRGEHSPSVSSVEATSEKARGPAPVAVFAYNRPGHLRQTLEALAANELARESEVIIYCDGPKPGADRSAVDATRAVARAATGFATVAVHEHTQNRGLSGNIIAGVTEVIARYGRAIVLEDDLVTSPHFLRYMNDGLAMYRDNPQVASIHGWCFRHAVPNPPETFFLRGADCLGWATWKRAWNMFEPDADKLLFQLRAQKLEYEFNAFGNYDYMGLLEKQVRREVSSWAVRWYASMFLQRMHTLYPGVSLVSHKGGDGSGTNVEVNDSFDSPLSEKPVPVSAMPVIEDGAMRKAFNAFLRSL